MPALFALVGLALPVELLIASRASEPFPGLFMPSFSDVPKIDDGGYHFSEATFAVGGESISPQTVFGIPEISRPRRLSRKHFPKEPDGPIQLAPDVRSAIAQNIAEATGRPPDTLEVTWERRRYDLDTGDVTVVRTYPSYEVTLEAAP
jgi:hypothetical protein